MPHAAFLFLLFVTIAASGHAADPIVLSSSVSAREVTVGDQFAYTLTAEWDATKIQIFAPAFGEKLGSFEVVKTTVRDERPENPAHSRKIWTLTLAVFDSGDQTIPVIPLSYKIDQKTERTAQFEGVAVKVLSGLDPNMKPGEAHGIKGPVAIAPDQKYRNRVLMIAGGALLLSALIALLIWRLRRGKSVEEVLVMDHRSPEQIAFDELDALLAAQFVEQGDVKAFYSTLGDILRAYLGRKYNFIALDMTTRETMDVLGHRIVSMHVKTRIEDVLNEADMAKFAKWVPSGETCNRSVESVRQLIDDLMVLTAPKPNAEVLAQ